MINFITIRWKKKRKEKRKKKQQQFIPNLLELKIDSCVCKKIFEF